MALPRLLGGNMRWTYLFALAAAAAIAITSPAVPAIAAISSSPADRVRIALLVYQSQTAREADLRRGDAVTRELRAKADAAEKIAAETRVQLASSKAKGAKAAKQIEMLERQLQQQQQSLADAAETYTSELAKRDQDYARERSILISTGQHLLQTPEGRRVLDLYNAGGEANWKEAREVIDEARRVRRALDARDAATLYFGAWVRGLEKTSAVIAIYEELLRDDPAQAADWLQLANMYADEGDPGKAFDAFDRALMLTSAPLERAKVFMSQAMAEASLYKWPSALGHYDSAISALRQHLATVPRDNPARAQLAKALAKSAELVLVNDINNKEKALEARGRAEEAIRIVHDLAVAHCDCGDQWLLFLAYKDLADYEWLTVGDDLKALNFYDKSIDVARDRLNAQPSSRYNRENLSAALLNKANVYFATRDGLYTDSPVAAVPLLQESLKILAALKMADPSSHFWDSDESYAKDRLAEATAVQAFLLAHPEEPAAPVAGALGQVGLANANLKKGRVAAALRYISAAKQEAARQLLTSEPAEHDVETYLWALNLQASASVALGQLSRASSQFRECISTADKYLAVQSNMWHVRRFRAGTFTDLAKLQLREGDKEGALQSLSEARSGLRMVIAGEPKLTQAHRDLYRALYHLAELGADGVTWADVVAEVGIMRAANLVGSQDELLAPDHDESILKAEQRARDQAQ